MDIGKIGNDYIKPAYNKAVNKPEKDGFGSALEKAVADRDENALKKACQDFESVFLNMVFKSMMATVPKSGLLENDSAMDTFQEMLDEKLSEEISRGRGIGVGDMLYKQLAKRMNAKQE